jgi:hypothetical protein
LERVETEIFEADPIRRVALIQERMDLENELHAADGGVDLVSLERDFVRFAKDYSSRKGISYNAWREVGVSPTTLKAAGITRSAFA